jgi:hypothetical protein
MIVQFWLGFVIGCLASAIFWLIILIISLRNVLSKVEDFYKSIKELSEEFEKEFKH